VQAVASFVDEELGKRGVKVIGAEGLREGQWALVDFGSVVVHVFHEYTRGVYDLESMWEKVPRLTVVEQPVARHVRQ
jgi:ribosome-associated protein